MTTSTAEITATGSEGGLIGLLRLLFRRRRLLGLVALGFGILGFVLAKVYRTWSVEATIRPQSSNASLSRVSGLAAQFGVNIPGSPVGDPVRFYSEVVQSREVLSRAVRVPFKVAKTWGSRDSLSGNFLELYNVKGVDSVDRLGRGRDKLRSLMTVTTDREAGFVRVKLVTKWPDLSLQLAKEILAITNSASIEKQRHQAEAERSFIEGRLAESQAALSDAENNMESFLTTNRQYRDSPLLTLQYGRLQRRVDLRQQLFASLAQAYEQARIDEVRDTPVLMIVDGVDGSLKTGRRAWRDAVLWAIAGIGFGVLLILGLDGLDRFRRENPGQLQRFGEELRATWPFRLLTRRSALS